MAAGHAYQYAPSNSAITRSSGCTWVTGATGIAVVTAGQYAPTPDKVHSLVKRLEETSPSTPGWSLEDLDLALSRYGMGFEVHKGAGWAAVENAHDQGRFIVIQGDSDQFANATCSGAFDGPHAIGVDGSRKKIEAGVEWWWIHDPICPTGRWERKHVIRNYAEKLVATVFMGWFAQRVPTPGTPTWRCVIQPGPNQKTRTFRRFLVDGQGRIVAHEPHRTAGMETPCTAPTRHVAAPGKPAAWTDDYVRLIAPGRKRNGWIINARFAKENA